MTHKVSLTKPFFVSPYPFSQCYFGTDESKITQELVTNCHNVCKPRLCCFGSYKLKDSCRASVGEEECELFSLCEQMISKDGGEVKTVVELDLKEFYDDTTDTSYFEENKKAIHDAVSIGFVSKLQIFSFQTPIAYYFLLEF